jgi:hypothetical protein
VANWQWSILADTFFFDEKYAAAAAAAAANCMLGFYQWLVNQLRVQT